MMRCVLVTLALGLPLLTGCALKEVRSKTKTGVEYRHSGTSRTDAERYLVQQGVQFKWDKGVSTTVSYRRRDTNDGNGNNDNGVWFEIGFPIWKAKSKPVETTERLATLERRIAELENRLQEEADHAG